MIGAIAGDIIGSVYEFDNIKTMDFPLFTDESNYTDDTIMTVAIADWLLNRGNLVGIMQEYGRKYPCPMGGYGARFIGYRRKNRNLMTVGGMVRRCG